MSVKQFLGLWGLNNKTCKICLILMAICKQKQTVKLRSLSHLSAELINDNCKAHRSRCALCQSNFRTTTVYFSYNHLACKSSNIFSLVDHPLVNMMDNDNLIVLNIIFLKKMLIAIIILIFFRGLRLFMG